MLVGGALGKKRSGAAALKGRVPKKKQSCWGGSICQVLKCLLFVGFLFVWFVSVWFLRVSMCLVVGSLSVWFLLTIF